LDEYLLLLLSMASSLLVALLSIRYERRLRKREEVSETLRGLLQETIYNIGVAKTILRKLDSDLKIVEEKEDLAPLPTLIDTAYLNATNRGMLVAQMWKEIKTEIHHKTSKEHRWRDLNNLLIECYSEVRKNLNSAIQMREQVKLLTLHKI